MRFWRRYRSFLGIALIVVMLPGWHELSEIVEHLFHDGHLPHSEQHEGERQTERHDDAGDTEHGCNALAHRCACHTSSPGLVANLRLDLDREPPVTRCGERRPIILAEHPVVRATAPPVRPPIA